MEISSGMFMANRWRGTRIGISFSRIIWRRRIGKLERRMFGIGIMRSSEGNFIRGIKGWIIIFIVVDQFVFFGLCFGC